MSPVARIRQVAACTLLVSFACLPLAADPATAAAAPAAAAPAPSPAYPGAPASPGPAPARTLESSPAPVPVQPAQLAPNATTRIAQSALLSVDGAPTADTLRLWIRRVSDKSLLTSTDVTVTVDGRKEAVTRDSGGGYELPLADLRGDGARDVDFTVAHDGIREILSGKVSLAEAGSGGGLLRDHKQVAWWILNIVIVLIAVIALSRRKG